MQIIDYKIELERFDSIEDITIDSIINQKYNPETTEVSIKFIDNHGLQHTITSMNYKADNVPAITITAKCVTCGDTKSATIANIEDLKTICKYHGKPVTSFEKIESLMNEMISIDDFFIVINAINKDNPFSCCDICSYQRPRKRPVKRKPIND